MITMQENLKSLEDAVKRQPTMIYYAEFNNLKPSDAHEMLGDPLAPNLGTLTRLRVIYFGGFNKGGTITANLFVMPRNGMSRRPYAEISGDPVDVMLEYASNYLPLIKDERVKRAEYATYPLDLAMMRPTAIGGLLSRLDDDGHTIDVIHRATSSEALQRVSYRVLTKAQVKSSEIHIGHPS
ncbi:MAG: hypothetical protein AABX51_04815 [Nanoarchaeota archaeon]